MKKYTKLIVSLLLLAVLLSGCTISVRDLPQDTENQSAQAVPKIEEYDAQAYDEYIVLNDNVPQFTESELTTQSFEQYAKLDELGRCGAAYACIGTDLMPTEKRGNISRVKPTGWHSIQYDSVEGKSLYNRCHLIAHQLAGEDANEKNLITGTRYMNVSGMLPFEEEVGDYVRETGNHVMYRVTPVFEGDNLLADGVQMEAYSVEDQGKGVSYNVYIFNAQPGIWIDYATGESREIQPDDMVSKEDASDFVLNTNTKKFHLPSCGNADKIQKENKENFTGDRQQLVKNGYEPCGSCNP